MNSMSKVLWRTALLIVLASAPGTAFGQSDGRFGGAVLDQSGAAVPGASVTIKNERTGETRTTTANAEGRFTVTNLKPSLYAIRATFGNFAPTEFTSLELVAAQDFQLDLQLRPAGVSENIVVEAHSPTVDVSSARIGVNVNQREVNDLPINGRQMSQLYLQAPGSLNSGTGTFGDIRFSGRAVQQNVIRYDGIEGTAIIDASPGNLNGETASPFRLQSSIENIQEFRVESNNVPAEYGTGTGGQISVVTKSGANVPRGSLFYYVRDDTFDARNAFDIAKSPLSLKQFGVSAGGPLMRDRAFFFVSYEGYRLRSGVNLIEAAPSALAFQSAVPAIQPLYSAFRHPDAVVLPGASVDPNFDILQLQTNNVVDEDSFSLRLDFHVSDRWSSYVRYFRDNGDSDGPDGLSGRRIGISAKPSNAVWVLQGVLSPSSLNEFKVGYNGAPTNVTGIALQSVPGLDLSNISISITGAVNNSGIAGQSAQTGVSLPGGIIRQNSAFQGRGTPYDPYSLSLVDTFNHVRGNHSFKFGAEGRLIRLETDRLGGITYTYTNLAAFLSNTLQSTSFAGDLSAPSPFNGGATGPRHTEQSYYVGYGQDEWHVGPRLTFNYGLRYEYYTPLRERDDLLVNFDSVNGVLLPNTDEPFRTRKNNVQPRVAATWALDSSARTILRGGFGLMVGPGQTEDQIQPVESDRIAATMAGGAYPIDPATFAASFVDAPNNRQYQPRAYTPDYNIPERVWQYTASVQRELPGGFGMMIGYVGSQGRNLFLRSITNPITEVQTNANPAQAAVVVRKFDIVTRNADGTVAAIQRPFAEIDVKTSGGHDDYNSLQTQLTRHLAAGLTLNAQYTLSRSYGNTAGSNEALTVANSAQTLEEFEYDNGYNRFDVRHTFNLSALYSLPVGRDRKFGARMSPMADALLGGWDLGGIVNARSGLPLDVRVTRADVAYLNTSNNTYVGNPCATCVAVINTPYGGASRGVRRPDLIPGVDPYLKDGLQWLNPAAFAIPAPGTYGNLTRGELRGPNFKQVDMLLSKRFVLFGSSRAEVRWEVFNVFNTPNYDVPATTLNNALGVGTNLIQPGEAFTQAAAGSTFGKLRSTVGTTVGLGTNRQMQFALRLQF